MDRIATRHIQIMRQDELNLSQMNSTEAFLGKIVIARLKNGQDDCKYDLPPKFLEAYMYRMCREFQIHHLVDHI